MTASELRKLRGMLGVNQSEFAQLLRVSLTTLNRWENGKAKPEKETAEQLNALRALLERKDADREKIRETLHAVGIGSAITWAATAGLIASRAIGFALLPLSGVAGVAIGLGALGSLFVRDLKKKKENRKKESNE